MVTLQTGPAGAGRESFWSKRTISRSFWRWRTISPPSSITTVHRGSARCPTWPPGASEADHPYRYCAPARRRRGHAMRINLLRGDTQILDRHCAVAAAGHSVRLGPRDRYQRRATLAGPARRAGFCREAGVDFQASQWVGFMAPKRDTAAGHRPAQPDHRRHRQSTRPQEGLGRGRAQYPWL